MKWFRNLLKGLSLTTALFVVQACYGTPQGSWFGERGVAPMTFSLVADDTGAPIEGIVVKGVATVEFDSDAAAELGVTGVDGKCDVAIPYLRDYEGPFLTFEDPTGNYAAKDTTLADLREREIVIKLSHK